MSGTRPRRVTLIEVAERAQVDPAVVSKLLNNDPSLKIRDTTRARVLGAVRELNYRPNAMARSLRTSRASAYGLLIPDFANPIYAAIITGAQAAAAERGCLLLTGSPVGALTGEHYLELVGQGRIDGLLLAGGHAHAELLERVDALALPWLLVNRRLDGSSRFVILDDERAVAIAVRHLASLGHQRIAHLAGPRTADTAQRRTAGYRAAMDEIGLPVHEDLIVEADYTNPGGAAAMTSLLAGLPTRRPTAVVVANVASAIGALRTVRDTGLEVPHDLSMVAIHDLPLADYLAPPLTTVRMPLEELGRRGIAILSTVAPGAPVEEVLTEPMELVERASTAPPRQQ